MIRVVNTFKIPSEDWQQPFSKFRFFFFESFDQPILIPKYIKSLDCSRGEHQMRLKDEISWYWDRDYFEKYKNR